MQHRPPPEPAPPPPKTEHRDDSTSRVEQDQRLRNAANNDAESGRNSSRSADDTRQSTE